MTSPVPEHKHKELHTHKTGVQLNSLRAAVLGANDGIVSTASLVLGVAGAAASSDIILITGVAGLTAGALSMAVGEYVSVSTQRDTEKALLEKERHELETTPDHELGELVSIYERKGVSHETAQKVAEELTAHDAFAAHVDVELGINPNSLTNPWHAAYASAASFTVGSLIPLFAIMLPSEEMRVPVTFASVLLALIMTGSLSAYAGGSSQRVATVRVVFGGLLAMAITYGIGTLFGVSSV
ncbi:MAG: VIT family protein [Candidatus Pacebacteria bacterium]|jgi:VIT1/CCC1 family predicted Fe2+/Mn2+ transporter|nr:VIT family protein [Candidatus Paceibacterota bacterium]